ncbi:MAG: Rieske 2Fe-2S domain-containing protein [Thermoguttaceae bacterium]|nr:Rieske 2Fe-2S domain-containing protein [Thermoguttaceae bacterium]MBR5759608.1 Rieske 2Fe-2S domain-containing protein [Thermoguttaceae bacterium]
MSGNSSSDKETKKCCCQCEAESEEQNRRSFCLSVLGMGMGAAALATPIYAGARMALYPLEQEGLSGKEYQLTTYDALDEVPRQFVVLDNVTDAWTTSPNQTIGVVYLCKKDNEDGTPGVAAFQTVCPHAGCRVKVGPTKNPATGETEMLFYCPCHGDTFYLNGERVQPENSKSARSLDYLEARVDETGKVFVKYQNFQLGTSERKPV